MQAKLSYYLKNNLQGDKIIWMIVFFLNTIGLLIQFSAKGRFNMSNPFDPIIGFIKPLIILIASIYIMAWVSRKDYTQLTKYVHVFLYLSWGLILMAFFFWLF